MNRVQTDVLVVGLGRRQLRRAHRRCGWGAGDRRRAARGDWCPVQCAEFVPLPMGKYALASEVFQQHVTGMTTILPSGEKLVSDFPGS